MNMLLLNISFSSKKELFSLGTGMLRCPMSHLNPPTLSAVMEMHLLYRKLILALVDEYGGSINRLKQMNSPPRIISLNVY